MDTATEKPPTDETENSNPETNSAPEPEIPFGLKPAEVTIGEVMKSGNLLEMPEAHEYAIQAAQERDGEPGRVPSPTGEEFDPEIHVTDKDGNPVYNSKGKFKRKPGRKKKTADGKKRVIIPPKPKVESESEKNSDKPEVSESFAAAFVIVGTCDLLVSSAISPEMSANEQEKDFLANAWARYLDEKGVQDIPPGTALVMAIATVYGQKLSRPEPRKKLLPMLDRMKVGAWKFWQKMRHRKNSRPVEKTENAQSDSRENS